MPSPFPFDAMVLLGWMASMLIIGVALRAKIPFFQRFLFPSCLIGGILGLVLTNAGVVGFAGTEFETYAYHFFNISFISVGLTQRGETLQGSQMVRGSAWMALMQGSTFGMQAALSGILVILLGALGLKLFPTYGFLVPLGFEEGPGQALSVGKVWEGFGFIDGATIGLTFAALGYFFAFFIGVPLVNRGIRRGRATYAPQHLPSDLLRGILDRQASPESAGRLRLHSGNVDSLAFQIALVGVVYLITYAVVKSLTLVVPPDVGKILWGFFFIFGLMGAIAMRKLTGLVGAAHLIDPGIQRRVTGWSIDFLIIATVMAIQLAVVWQHIVPITIIALANGVVTTLYITYLGYRLSHHALERTAAVYGAVTGTVSCGLLLLRIADPEFKTPVAFELGLMNVFSIPPIGLCMVLVNGPLWWNWSIGLTVLVFTGIMLLCLGLIRIMGLENIASTGSKH